MRVRRTAALAGVMVAALVLSGHVGMSDAVVDAMAGPYPVRVVVRTAGVVPGLAEVSVRALDGAPTSASVQVAPGALGFSAAPRPEPMRLASPGLFAAELWLMTRGAYQVRVVLEGSQGPGTIIVPVNSVPTRRLGMSPAVGWVLAALGVLLLAGALTIIRAAVRDALVPSGVPIDDASRRRGWRALVVGSIVLTGALVAGWAWWRSEDLAYQRSLDRPLLVSAMANGDSMRIEVTDSLWNPRAMSPVIPDHGKMMHLFLVRDGTLEALAHLHPSYDGGRTFSTALPALAPGLYRLFGDVVHEDGLTRTLTARVALSGGGRAISLLGDPDASMHVAPAIGRPGAAGPLSAALEGGGSMSWERAGALVAGPETTIRIMVRDGAGRPAAIEPYMGMRGHAIIMRDDGGVFVHVHPAGTISLAAQQAMASRESAHGLHAVALDAEPGIVKFPFAFPTPGRYRIWVQVRSDNAIRTGTFDTAVESGAGAALPGG